MSRYFLEQLKNHPSMKPQDIVKLCYQATFGAEHLLTDLERARQYLYEEFKTTEAADSFIYENISDLYCRVNIASWKYRGFSQELLFELFSKSAAIIDDLQNFKVVMDSYLATAIEVMSTEAYIELTDYLVEYYAKGIRPVHHSEEYRQAEKPHYRVVRRELLPEELE
ncbi:MAG: hypothetical protein GX208_01675 [Firmicutes bacterium]|nr:hypothetical protein [Bacillota bacterium]